MEIEHDNIPWNKGRIIGQKRPLQIFHIGGIRIRLELEGKGRDLALFNMALDSKLLGCDLFELKISDGPRVTLFRPERQCCSQNGKPCLVWTDLRNQKGCSSVDQNGSST